MDATVSCVVTYGSARNVGVRVRMRDRARFERKRSIFRALDVIAGVAVVIVITCTTKKRRYHNEESEKRTSVSFQNGPVHNTPRS